MSKTYVTADTHLGHDNIIKYENRPFMNIDDMTDTIIKNWNNVVSKKDRVFVLGDFSFYDFDKTKEIVSMLNGYKVLVMGNHDIRHPIKWWVDAGFDVVSKYPIIVDQFIVMQHEPPTYFNEGVPYFWLYGHVHSTDMYKTITKNTACVCIERWNYIPVDIKEIEKLSKLV